MLNNIKKRIATGLIQSLIAKYQDEACRSYNLSLCVTLPYLKGMANTEYLTYHAVIRDLEKLIEKN